MSIWRRSRWRRGRNKQDMMDGWKWLMEEEEGEMEEGM